jgi:hypothetical protein
MLVSRKGPNMINQISLKPIMDVAIMQTFCGMHELFPRCHPCCWLSQLTLKILVLVIYVVVPLFSTILLCMITQAVIIFHILSGLQVLAG